MSTTHAPNSLQARYAYYISTGFTITGLLFAIVYLGLISAGYAQWQMWVAFASQFIFILAGLVSIYLTRTGRHASGIRLLLISLYLTVFGVSLFVENVGLALGITLVVISLGVSTVALSQRESVVAFFLSIGAGAFSTALDVINVPWHISVPPMVRFITTAAYLAAAATIILVGWQFRRLALTNKLLAGFSALALFISFAQGALIISNLREVVDQGARLALEGAAQQTAAEIDRYLSSNLATVDAAAQVPLLGDYLQLPEDLLSYNTMDGDVNQFMRNLRSADLKNISGYMLLDAKGRVVKDTTGYMYPYSAKIQYNDRDFFTQPRDLGTAYVSLPQFTIKPNPATAYIYLSAPIYARRTREFLGVLTARYRADALQTLVSAQNGKLGMDSFAALYAPLESNYIHLAHGARPDLALSLVGPENAARLTALQNHGYLSLRYMETLSAEMPDLLRSLQASGNTPYFTAPKAYAPLGQDDENNPNDDVYQGVAQPLQTSNWLVAYYEPQTVFSAALASQVSSNQLIALIVTALAAAATALFTQFITRPVRALDEAARRMAAGDLDVQAAEDSEDELGQLGRTLNHMAARLKETLQEMEARIAARTADAERRSAQIRAAAEVGRAANQIRDIGRLLPQVTELISERFGFYHVGIFLLDERGEYAVLQAANSMGGQRMLARGHRLRIGQEGIVGYATGRRRPRIALDVGEDAVFFDNPDLPATRSEMAIPLIVGDELLGALDVQSTEANAFSDEDIEIMQVLADQLAIAIANARLFARNQQALEEIRRAYGEVAHQAWFNLLNARRSLAFAALPNTVTPVETSWDAEALQAMRENRPQAAKAPDSRGRYRLTLPVRAGGVTLGVITAWKQDYPWAEVEIELLETILRELGLTLDGSRLFEEAQRRAQLEQASAQVVTRLRETLDIQAMLRAAAQEIRQALSLPEVSVRLTGLEAEEDAPADGQPAP